MIYKQAKILIREIIPDIPLLNKPEIQEAKASGAPKSDVIAFPKLIKKFCAPLLPAFPIIIYIILR